MKILHLIETDGIYGAEKVVLDVCRQLNRSNKYIPQIVCIVTDARARCELYEEAVRQNISARLIKINMYTCLIDIFRAMVVIKSLCPGLIHSHGYKGSILGFLFSLISRIPIVSTCHLRFFGNDCTLMYLMLMRVETFLFRYFNKIVCVSTEIMKFLVSSGVRSETCCIVYNGIEPIKYSNHIDTTNLFTKLGIKEGDFVVLNIGRLCEQKAQINIVKAAKKLKVKITNIVFLIAGDGELRNELTLAIKDFGLERSVKLLGFRRDIGQLQALADLFLLVSLDEGLPICILEAMANGKPIISTRVGGVPDILLDMVDSVLISAGDVDSIVESVAGLYYDRALSTRLGRNALNKFNSNFTSAICYSRYKHCYDEILGI